MSEPVRLTAYLTSFAKFITVLSSTRTAFTIVALQERCFYRAIFVQVTTSAPYYTLALLVPGQYWFYSRKLAITLV